MLDPRPTVAFVVVIAIGNHKAGNFVSLSRRSRHVLFTPKQVVIIQKLVVGTVFTLEVVGA